MNKNWKTFLLLVFSIYASSCVSAQTKLPESRSAKSILPETRRAQTILSYSQSAQTIPPDSLSLSGIDSIKNQYFKQAGSNSELYIGPEYEPYSFRTIDGTVFLDSKEWIDGAWINGNLSYNKMIYQNLPLKYDEVQEKVITVYINKNIQLQLISEKVDSFNIATHHFINFRPDNKDQKILAAGFYDVIQAGKSKIFVRRHKIILETINDRVLEHRVQIAFSYYLVRNGTINAFSNEKSLINLLGLPGHKVKSYLRSIQVKYRHDPELAMLKIVAFADQR